MNASCATSRASVSSASLAVAKRTTRLPFPHQLFERVDIAGTSARDERRFQRSSSFPGHQMPLGAVRFIRRRGPLRPLVMARSASSK